MSEEKMAYDPKLAINELKGSNESFAIFADLHETWSKLVPHEVLILQCLKRQAKLQNFYYNPIEISVIYSIIGRPKMDNFERFSRAR